MSLLQYSKLKMQLVTAAAMVAFVFYVVFGNHVQKVAEGAITGLPEPIVAQDGEIIVCLSQTAASSSVSVNGQEINLPGDNKYAFLAFKVPEDSISIATNKLNGARCRTHQLDREFIARKISIDDQDAAVSFNARLSLKPSAGTKEINALVTVFSFYDERADFGKFSADLLDRRCNRADKLEEFGVRWVVDDSCLYETESRSGYVVNSGDLKPYTSMSCYKSGPNGGSCMLVSTYRSRRLDVTFDSESLKDWELIQRAAGRWLDNYVRYELSGESSIQPE